MSHRIYTTPGFVIASKPYGEGGRILFIFTAELGRVSAIAQGIRLSKSKLRYHAQDYSLANFSLVRGKEFWRVVGAEAIEKKPTSKSGSTSGVSSRTKLSTTDPAYALLVRMFFVLTRLLQGEEKNEPLFDSVLSTHEFLNDNSVGHVDQIKTVIECAEPIIMLRILHHLGYVRATPELASFLVDNQFTPKLLEVVAVPGMKARMIKEINTALKESHL